jgi:hypothetical protein
MIGDSPVGLVEQANFLKGIDHVQVAAESRPAGETRKVFTPSRSKVESLCYMAVFVHPSGRGKMHASLNRHAANAG